MQEEIVALWWNSFRNTHITARQAVTSAIEGDDSLLKAITNFAEEGESLVASLRRWLRQHEGVPFYTTEGIRVCFILRDNARWQLYPVVYREVVAA